MTGVNSVQQDQVPPSPNDAPTAYQPDEKAGGGAPVAYQPDEKAGGGAPVAYQPDEKAGGGAPVAYQLDEKAGGDKARAPGVLQNVTAASPDSTLSRRGPVLVLMVAYAVICAWDLLMDVAYSSDPNAMVMTLIITGIVLDAGSLLLTLFGLWAFVRDRVACMAGYVYGLMGFQLLATVNLVLFCVAPLPQYLLDAISAAASNPGVKPEDIPSEGSLKLHQGLYMGVGLLFRGVYVILVRRYYLGVRKSARRAPSENA